MQEQKAGPSLRPSHPAAPRSVAGPGRGQSRSLSTHHRGGLRFAAGADPPAAESRGVPAGCDVPGVLIPRRRKAPHAAPHQSGMLTTLQPTTALQTWEGKPSRKPGQGAVLSPLVPALLAAETAGTGKYPTGQRPGCPGWALAALSVSHVEILSLRHTHSMAAGRGGFLQSGHVMLSHSFQ